MSIAEDFTAFWQRYPRKVGKLAALKAYEKARKLASAEDILSGIDRYIEAKPAYADWCHPQTFLNQGRFLDEPDVKPSYEWNCPHTPHCPHRAACAVVSQRKKRAPSDLWMDTMRRKVE